MSLSVSTTDYLMIEILFSVLAILFGENDIYLSLQDYIVIYITLLII